ncbi:hypothetical protein JHK87_051106 [Glycine soja]|nr:hypothetical protein JHK87_051106 [Glycine soja]
MGRVLLLGKWMRFKRDISYSLCWLHFSFYRWKNYGSNVLRTLVFQDSHASVNSYFIARSIQSPRPWVVQCQDNHRMVAVFVTE